ncbi:DUF3280 domain-containing protein [Oryzibacter oryziterrae]|uniref:DUF3280 domain-containing protein n=1 Tax=Oryzibacter oryziterrae TaxID=2766474 RepID=UPI001F389582|nr:DUF3280 domain-containing protein [Oryzibacter oryziterrae]
MSWLSFRLAVILAMLLSAGPALAAQKLAFFGYRMINSSMQETSAVETGRIATLTREFEARVGASGKYEIAPVPEAARAALAKTAGMGECNGCEPRLGAMAGADLVAWGTVQKVSNLILNVNIYVADVKTGQFTFIKSADMRNNTDESWHRAQEYILKNYFLK